MILFMQIWCLYTKKNMYLCARFRATVVWIDGGYSMIKMGRT